MVWFLTGFSPLSWGRGFPGQYFTQGTAHFIKKSSFVWVNWIEMCFFFFFFFYRPMSQWLWSWHAFSCSFFLTFRWQKWRVTTGGWGFIPTKMTAASAGPTTLCSIMCPGPSGGHTHWAVTANVSTCLPAKVRDLKRLNLIRYRYSIQACLFHLTEQGIGPIRSATLTCPISARG